GLTLVGRGGGERAGREGPGLEGEATRQVGGPVEGAQGLLDGEGAAAAAGVEKGALVGGVGQGEEACGERLLEGGLNAFGAVAAAVQRLAAGVEGERRLLAR